jgi:hypothetical protein
MAIEDSRGPAGSKPKRQKTLARDVFPGKGRSEAIGNLKNKGTPEHYLSTFLSRPASSIPKGAQWAVMFDDLEGSILPAIDLAYKREPNASEWQTTAAAKTILTEEYQETKGCMFCQAIGLPGEGMNANVEGNIKSNAFLRSYVGGGRTDFATMRMTFIDTNISFCDSFLRGWALATANFGLVARSGDKNYRTRLTCFKFGITPTGPIILQTVTFHGICCISVSEEEYNYNAATAPVEREARFIFHSYSVNTEDPSSSPLRQNITSKTDIITKTTQSLSNQSIA